MGSPAATKMEAAAEMFHLRSLINVELRRLGLPELLTLGSLKAWGDNKPESFVILGVEESVDIKRQLTITVTFTVKGSSGTFSFSLLFNRQSGEEEAYRVIPHVVVEGTHYVACVREARLTGYFDPTESKHGPWMTDFARGFPANDAVTRLQEPLLSETGLHGVPEDVVLKDEYGHQIVLPALRGDVRLRVTRLALRKLGPLLLEPGPSGFALRRGLRPIEWRFMRRGLENSGNSPNVLSTFTLEMSLEDPTLLGQKFVSSNGSSVRFYALRDLMSEATQERINLRGELAWSSLHLLYQKYLT